MINTSIECVLPRPDIAELSEDIRSELSRRLLGGAPVLPLSSEDILAFVMAGTVNLMHGYVTQVLKENDPDTMCCDNLVRYAARHGLNMYGATRAKGYIAISGDDNAVIPPTLRFVGISSAEYKIDPGVMFNPIRLDATGHAVIRVVSTVGGAIFNVPSGTPMSVATTEPGINVSAMVVGNGLIGGSNDEECEALRRRVIASDAGMVMVVNNAWYLQKSLSYPGVTRVCTEECGECCDPRHVNIYPFFEGVYGDIGEAPYGVPPADVLDEMTDWMFGRNMGKGEGLAPVGQTGAYYCAHPTVIDVTLWCFRGCPETTRQRVEDAMRNFLRASYCTGSKICKDELRAVAYQMTGRDTCFAEVELTFDESLRAQDDGFAFLSCDRFPVLGEVRMVDRESGP